MPSAPSASPRKAQQLSDGRSAADARGSALRRLAVVVVAILGGEILARFAFDTDNLPHGMWLVLDSLARLGRLAALAAVVWLGLALLSLLSPSSDVIRLAASAVAW